MIGPILSGVIITRMEKFTGYTVIFTISLCMFVVAVLMSFMLKRRSAEGKFYFRRILAESKNNANWRHILHAHFFQGLREGTFIFVIIVWVYIATGSELAIGTYGLVASAVQFVSYYAVTRLVKSNMRKKSILIGGSILYAAIFLIVFDLSFTRLIMYGVVISIAYPLLLVPYISLTYDVIGKSWRAAEMRVEYIVVRELFLNAGRILSILAFLVTITFFPEEKGIPIILMILGIGHSLIYFFVRHVHFQDEKDGKPYSLNTKKNGEGDSGSAPV